MALVKGPFTIVWGDLNDPTAILHDVEEIDVSVDVESNDYTTVDGKRYTLYGAISANAALTLLDSNLDVLAAVLPQYTKAAGQQMSSGEAVNAGYTAIDIVAAQCDAGYPDKKDLHIISCSTNGGEESGSTAAGREVMTIKGCSTSLTALELPDNQLRTIQITFTGEPGDNTIAGTDNFGKPIAAIQMYRTGALAPVSA